MFGRRSSCRTCGIILLAIIFVASCAKQTKGPYKQVKRGQKEILIQENTEPAESSEYSAAQELVNKGKKEFNSGDFEKASRTFEAAINMEPGNGVAYFWLAKTNLELNDIENAKQLLDRASIYLTDDDWKEKIEALKEEIDQSENETQEDDLSF